MHYETVKELPETIRDVLPNQAKEVYRKAYNLAWGKFDKDARMGLDQHGMAHQQGWMAVRHEYVFDLDQWHRKGEAVGREEPKTIFDKIKSLFSK